MTQDDYANQVIHGVVGPQFDAWRKTGLEYTLYEDGNRSHRHKVRKGLTTNVVREAKDFWDITWVASPPTSPDFNLIERMWLLIKERIRHRPVPITNLTELKTAAVEEWDRMESHDWYKLYDTIPERLQQCAERDGYMISF